MAKKSSTTKKSQLAKRSTEADYDSILSEMIELLESARRAAARSVNAIMTATYWEMGRRIVEVEQRGKKRAEYGEQVLEKLAEDLTKHFGRGFSLRNLRSFRAFYLAYSDISETASRKAVTIRQTVSAELSQPQHAALRANGVIA